MLLPLYTSLSAILIATIALLCQFHSTMSAPFRNSLDSTDLVGDYPLEPNEVLPIQPLLLHPKPQNLKYRGRKLERDNEIIYIKLIRRKSYKPKKQPSPFDRLEAYPTKELTTKDIFYVQAVANGQFSHHRLKWYRLPEFYAISVFRKDKPKSTAEHKSAQPPGSN